MKTETNGLISKNRTPT